MSRVRMVTTPPDTMMLAVITSGRRVGEKWERNRASRVALPMTCVATRAAAAMVAATPGPVTVAGVVHRPPSVVAIAREYIRRDRTRTWSVEEGNRRAPRAVLGPEGCAVPSPSSSSPVYTLTPQKAPMRLQARTAFEVAALAASLVLFA